MVLVYVRGYGVVFLCRGKIPSLLSEGRCGGGAIGREKGFAGVVSLGLPCAIWLVATVEVVLRNTGMKDFIKSFSGGSTSLVRLLR